jgi:hypothetical protein
MARLKVFRVRLGRTVNRPIKSCFPTRSQSHTSIKSLRFKSLLHNSSIVNFSGTHSGFRVDLMTSLETEDQI